MRLCLAEPTLGQCMDFLRVSSEGEIRAPDDSNAFSQLQVVVGFRALQMLRLRKETLKGEDKVGSASGYARVSARYHLTGP